MGDPSSVDVILDFLRRNQFTRAEAALRSEIGTRPELVGLLQKLTLEEKESVNVSEGENGNKRLRGNQVFESRSSGEVSKELIVKEIECGSGRKGSESNRKDTALAGDRNKPCDANGTSEKKRFTFSKGSEDAMLDLRAKKFNPSSGPYQYDGDISNLSELHVTEKPRHHPSDVPDIGKASVPSGEERTYYGEKGTSWIGSTSKISTESKYAQTETSQIKELNRHLKISNAYSQTNITDNPWSKREEPTDSSSELWKDCSVKTVFPFSRGDVSTSYDNAISADKKEKSTDCDLR